MSSHPAVTPTFTKSDESWSVEITLVVFDSLQILNNSDNVFKNYDNTEHFSPQTPISMNFSIDLSTLYLYRMRN